MTTTGRGRGRGRWGGAGVIVPFAAITTKSIIHLYKLKAKNSPINDKHVVKCCHGHCCSPVRAATGAASAVVVVVVAVLVDIFISKLILIDYILCATVQTAAAAAAAARSGHTLSRSRYIELPFYL